MWNGDILPIEDCIPLAFAVCRDTRTLNGDMLGIRVAVVAVGDVQGDMQGYMWNQVG